MADITVEVTYEEFLCWFDPVSDFSCFVLIDQNRTSAHHWTIKRLSFGAIKKVKLSYQITHLWTSPFFDS